MHLYIINNEKWLKTKNYPKNGRKKIPLKMLNQESCISYKLFLQYPIFITVIN